MATCLLGLFDYEEDLISAAESLKESGFKELSIMSPVPLHEAEHVLGLHKSPVRRFSLVGAITGSFSGFAIAVACALVFILPVSGRPIITIPPFLIITYEVTILFGILATLIGFFIVAKLPAWQDAAYRIESNYAGFTLAVGVTTGSEKESAEKILKEKGATEVTEEEKRI